MVKGKNKHSAAKSGKEAKNEHQTPQHEQITNPIIFFYMPNEKFGEFCQWFPSIFTVGKAQISELVGHTVDQDDPNGQITFNCAEQFVMYCKAARFHDTNRQARVLATDSPKEQKRLGKETVGFVNESWDDVKSQVVEAGNIAKFSQNDHMRNVLLGRGDRLVCEASSRDRVWGIGYKEKHAMQHAMQHEQHWGENRLGKALMAVREHLRKQLEKETKAREPWKQWEEETV